MSWQPFSFITPVTSQTGSLSSQTLFTAPSTGYYVISYYMSPATNVLAATATLALTFTEGGVSRTVTATTLSLTTLSPALSSYLMIRADAGTAVTFSVTALGTAAYNVHLGWKAQGS